MSLKGLLYILLALGFITLGLWVVYSVRVNNSGQPITLDSLTRIINPPDEDFVKISNDELWTAFLTDMGWEDKKECRTLTGDLFDCSNLVNLKLEYSPTPLLYLTQQEGPDSPVFASVEANVEGADMTIKVHVDGSKLNGTEEDNWWISHQVIRVLNIVLNPRASNEEVIDLDKNAFNKYEQVNLLDF